VSPGASFPIRKGSDISPDISRFFLRSCELAPCVRMGRVRAGGRRSLTFAFLFYSVCKSIACFPLVLSPLTAVKLFTFFSHVSFGPSTRPFPQMADCRWYSPSRRGPRRGSPLTGRMFLRMLSFVFTIPFSSELFFECTEDSLFLRGVRIPLPSIPWRGLSCFFALDTLDLNFQFDLLCPPTISTFRKIMVCLGFLQATFGFSSFAPSFFAPFFPLPLMYSVYVQSPEDFLP